uniref:Uncharacterized protein n=1 Tax=Trichogramma kaykai TaxID=54128 RepID=A0ABD2WXB3_9HYME
MISRFCSASIIFIIGLFLVYRTTLAQVDGYTPGVDYPIYNTVPFGLSFTCRNKIPGYYADPDTRCQVSTMYGIGACPVDKNSVFFVLMVRCSVKQLVFAIGGSRLIVKILRVYME